MSEEWSFEKDDFLTTTPYEALYAYFEQLLNMYLCLLRIQNSKPFRICKMRRRCSSEIDFDRFSDHFNSCIWVLMRRT